MPYYTTGKANLIYTLINNKLSMRAKEDSGYKGLMWNFQVHKYQASNKVINRDRLTRIIIWLENLPTYNQT